LPIAEFGSGSGRSHGWRAGRPDLGGRPRRARGRSELAHREPEDARSAALRLGQRATRERNSLGAPRLARPGARRGRRLRRPLLLGLRADARYRPPHGARRGQRRGPPPDAPRRARHRARRDRRRSPRRLLPRPLLGEPALRRHRPRSPHLRGRAARPPRSGGGRDLGTRSESDAGRAGGRVAVRVTSGRGKSKTLPERVGNAGKLGISSPSSIAALSAAGCFESSESWSSQQRCHCVRGTSERELPGRSFQRSVPDTSAPCEFKLKSSYFKLIRIWPLGPSPRLMRPLPGANMSKRWLISILAAVILVLTTTVALYGGQKRSRTDIQNDSAQQHLPSAPSCSTPVSSLEEAETLLPRINERPYKSSAPEINGVSDSAILPPGPVFSNPDYGEDLYGYRGPYYNVQ